MYGKPGVFYVEFGRPAGPGVGPPYIIQHLLHLGYIHIYIYTYTHVCSCLCFSPLSSYVHILDWVHYILYQIMYCMLHLTYDKIQTVYSVYCIAYIIYHTLYIYIDYILYSANTFRNTFTSTFTDAWYTWDRCVQQRHDGVRQRASPRFVKVFVKLFVKVFVKVLVKVFVKVS